MDIVNKKGVVCLVVFLTCLTITSLVRSVEVELNEDSPLLQVVHSRNRRSNGDKIEITGNITFRNNTPQAIPSNSRLKVEFRDARIADAPSKKLGETLVNLANYKNSTPLFYNMTARKPTEHGHYSVSAVLNMGWTPAVDSDEWLRNGDYHTDTRHEFFVNITHGKNNYVRDIELVYYLRSEASINLGNQVVVMTTILAMLLMYFQF